MRVSRSVLRQTMFISASSSVSLLFVFVLVVVDSSVGEGDGSSVDGGKQGSKIPSCQPEISRLCGNKDNFDDLDALYCILNHKRNEADELSTKCNHELWLYRKSVTEPSGFLSLASSQCQDHYKAKSVGCWGDSKDQSNLINCIIDNKDKYEIDKCRELVTRLESVVFGDFELIGRFADKCLSDIEHFKCGRNEMAKSNDKLPHSQGETIECLSKNVRELKDECAVEILRIAELQVEDFHLDRALYFACRDDREKFCSRVTAGNSRVYKCLAKHKLEMEMSGDCREQIYRRQRLGWQDYRASGIVATCKTEIRRFKCRREASSTSDKNVRLAQILLCLENAAHTGKEINGDCVNEIKQHRRSLMEDYRITPDLLSACAKQSEYCLGNGVNANTIHCLMALAQSRKMNERIGTECRAKLEDFMKITDVSGDWRVDPVLQQNCLPVVDRSSCSSLPPNRVLDCLMNLLTSDTNQGSDANVMTEDCETTLLQIQYFISRDFPMDSVLFELCREDAEKVCGANKDWAPDTKQFEPSRGPLVFSCLFRNIGGDGTDGVQSQVSRPCADKVRETMRRRAVSVRLMPEIEDACLRTLADLCTEKTKPGEELNCLQDHYDELPKDCKIAISNFTEIEMKNPTINPYLFKYCRDLIENKCSDDKSEGSDLLECLIEMKPEMKSKKCRATVEHLQILQVKDFNFTPKFKSQCHEHVVRNCNTGNRMTAGSLVSCLSEIIRNDTLSDSTQRITKGCRKQVRNLVLSKIQLENDQLDKNSIYSVCRESVRRLCADVKPGGGRILECISRPENRAKLADTDERCYKSLFKIQQDVNNDGSLDIQLQKDCSAEIRLFCSGRTDDLVSCLLKASNQKENFNDEVCGKTLRLRRIEQNADVRLNPRLRKACKLDIPKFCSKVEFGDGKVISCLKKVFVIPQNRLTSTCKEHIAGMMEGAAQKDVRIDNALYVACKEDIDLSCRATEDTEHGDGGKTEECLKMLFHEKKLKLASCKDQVKQLIQSTLVDIHVDPILNQACSIDLIKRCDNVPPGEGRMIACLLTVLEEDKEKKISRLSEKCRDLLSLRAEMFQLAASSKLDSIQDIYQVVQKSSHKNYFLTFTMTIVGLIFMFGLFCGRASRRKIEFKDK